MTLKQYIKLSQMEYASTSFFPGFMGILYAWYNYDTFHLGFSLLGLLTVGLFQLAISLRDNYLDYVVAEDKDEDSVQDMTLDNETILLKDIRFAYYWTWAVAFITGSLLVFQTSFLLGFILLGGLLIGILYTFGPVPISSTPFGDFFIGLAYGFGIFFALFYVNTYEIVHFDWVMLVQIIIASIPTAITVMSVSLANNISDLEEDIEDGRLTLPYYIGVDKALAVFRSFYYNGYLAIILSLVFGTFPKLVALSLLTFPYVEKNIRIFMKKQEKETTFLTTLINSIVIPIPLILTFFIGSWLNI